jgi:uncharacterized protein with FMN-binding domain
MKKIIASFVFVAGFIGYVVYADTRATTSDTQALTIADTSAGIVTEPVTPTSSTAGSAPPTPAPAPVVVSKKPVAATGRYTNGSYTGVAANAYYGNIQVKATISGGKLTDVTFLQYPQDRSTSRYINQQAMPMLRAEAIQAQSANVDGVSGASDTSAAFKESLASALAKA